MADTELRGTITFDVDTDEAEQGIEEFSRREGQREGANFGRNFGEQAARKLQDNLKSLGRRMGGIFGSQTIVSPSTFGSIGGGAAGGGGGTTIIAPGAARGAAGAARGGGALAGAAGVAGATAAVVGGFAVLGIAAKKLTETLLGKSRDLAQSSPALAATMSVFDTRMQLINMRIGNQLAPSMSKLTDALADLFDTVSGPLATGLSLLSDGMAKLVRELDQTINAAEFAAKGLLLAGTNGQVNLFGSELRQAQLANGLTNLAEVLILNRQLTQEQTAALRAMTDELQQMRLKELGNQNLPDPLSPFGAIIAQSGNQNAPANAPLLMREGQLSAQMERAMKRHEDKQERQRQAVREHAEANRR